MAQDNLKIVQTGDDILEIGDVAIIKKSRRNKIPINRPTKFFRRVHMDIGYGDCNAIGGAKYCILFVDQATRANIIFMMCGLSTMKRLYGFLFARIKMA